MDTLAYLYLAQENEGFDPRELTLNSIELSKWITTGVLGIGCTVGVLSVAESASACYRPCRPHPYPVRSARPYPVAHQAYAPRYYASSGYGGGDYYGYARSYGVSDQSIDPSLIGYVPPRPPAPFRPVTPSAPSPPPTSAATPASTSDSTSSSVSAADTSSSDLSSSDYYTGFLYHGNDGVASIGYYGEIVTAAQQRLKELGYYQGEVDSLFGPLTLEAVLAYQEAEGLQLVDGIIGPETRASLGV